MVMIHASRIRHDFHSRKKMLHHWIELNQFPCTRLSNRKGSCLLLNVSNKNKISYKRAPPVDQPYQNSEALTNGSIQLAYLAPPDSRERSTSGPLSRAAAEVGTPHKTTAAVSGSAGSRAAAPVPGTRRPAAETPRRRTGDRRCRTAGVAAVVAPRAGTRMRRTSPPSEPCRRHRASHRPYERIG